MEEKEITREELIAQNEALKSQNSQLYMHVQRMNIENVFKRLDYLFKVLDYEGLLNSQFVKECADEIVAIMTPPKEEEKTEDESK